MRDVQTPEVKQISVQAHFRRQGESKRLIRGYERATPTKKEKSDGNTRQETTKEG